MAKKVAASSANPPKTECEQGPGDLDRLFITARSQDQIDYRLTLCKTNATVRVYLDEQLEGEADGADQVPLTLGPLSPGNHMLRWVVVDHGEEWQTKAEVKISGVTKFLLRKSNQSTNSIASGFLGIVVAP